MAIKSITVKGDPVQVELLCDAAITPGHLVERTTTGAKVHATIGGNCQKMFALEDEMKGGEIGTAYTISNKGQFGIFKPGDQVQARITTSQTITVGDWLESAGDGTLREHTPPVDSSAYAGTSYTNAIVGVAVSAVTTTGAAGVCIVEIV